MSGEIDPVQWDIAKAAGADAYALFKDPNHVGRASTPTEALAEIYFWVHAMTYTMLLHGSVSRAS